MALSVTVGAVNQTAYVLHESMTLRYNSFDFSLKNPATTPALGNTVTLVDPAWVGEVVSVRTTDATKTYKYVTITATNTDEAAASAGPFGLSDGATNYGPFSTAVLATAASVAHWRLGEATPGTGTAVDVMATNNGTYNASPTSVAGALTGDLNTAVTFNGTTQFVSVPAHASLNGLSTAFSVAAWIYSTDATNNGAIFDKTVGGGSNTQFTLLGYFGVGVLRWRLVKGGVLKDLDIAAPAINSWHFVVGTYDGTTSRIYLDGVAGTTLAVASPIDSGSGTSLIASDASGTERFKGRVDEVVVSSRALTAAEIAALYAAGTTSPTYSYRDLSVTLTTNLDASTETTGSAIITHSGLWPAMTFLLTNANRGYSAQSFSVRDVTVTWPMTASPQYRIEFGDPIVTMSVWVASQFGNVPDGSISGTKITDLSIETPKLAAASITADKLSIGQRTSGSLVPNYSFEDFDAGTTVPVLWSPSVVGTGTVTSIAGGQHGVRCLDLHAASGGTDRADANGAAFPVTASQRYYVSSWRFHNPGSASGAYLRISWFDNTLAAISDTDLIANAATVFAWTRWEGYVTAPALAAYATMVLINYHPATTGELVWDEVVMLPFIGGLKNSTAEVVIDASGITVTNGAITVTNAGATVIIDGTSDMFRIAATGTLSSVLFAAPGNPGSQVSVTVATGFTYRPATLVYLLSVGAHLLPMFVADNAGALVDWWTSWAEVSGGTSTKVQIAVSSTRAGGLAAYSHRYYILEQAAI